LILLAFAPLPSQTVLRISDFGARGDGKFDCTPALQRVLSAARKAGPCEIRVGAGAWRFLPTDPEASSVIPLVGLTNLSLVGEGPGLTTLVVGNPKVSCLRVEASRQIRMAGFAIDYDPVPFTQGTVVSVETNLAGVAGSAPGETARFDLRLDPAYLPPDDPRYSSPNASWGAKVIPGVYWDLWAVRSKRWEHPSPDLVRFFTDARGIAQSGLKAGDRFAHSFRWYVRDAVVCWASQSVALEDVHIWASPSTTTVWANSEDLVIRGLAIAVKPGSDRLISSCADGIHAFGVRGRFLIEGCRFEGMLDDGINVHCRAAHVMEGSTPERLRINNAGTFDCRPGDRLQVWDGTDGRIKAELKVAAVAHETGIIKILSLERAVEGLRMGKSRETADNLFNLDACCAGVVIRSNYFGHHRGRAIVCKAVGARIEGNAFENVDGLAVGILQESGWGEGPVPRDILITGNTFTGVPRLGSAANPSIRTHIAKAGGQVELPLIENVRIVSNRFVNPRVGAMDIRNASGVEILANTVLSDPTNVHDFRLPVLMLMHSRGIRVDGLAVDDPQTDVGIKIYPTVPQGEVTLANLAFRIRPGGTNVVDARGK